MKDHSSEKWSQFSIILIIVLTMATLFCIFRSIALKPIFHLNENQLLYLFSAMAQIIGSIFGLTLTAYVFFVDKFKESARNDDTYYDATAALLSRYFRILTIIAFICGTTVLSCISGIIALHNWEIVYPFIIDESVFLFLIGISSILFFGTMLLDPEKLDKEIVKMKKKAEQFYQPTQSAISGDFREFLKTYNLLEHLIIEFAQACVMDQSTQYRYFRPQIIQSLKVLNGSEIINGALLSEINELRMYRNGLVHGIDFDIDQAVCDRITQIYDTLNHAFETFNNVGRNSEEWSHAIKRVYSLTSHSN